MYGQQATAVGRDTAANEVSVRVSDINNGTINMLENCRRSSDHLLGKVSGPRPEEENKQVSIVPSLMSDAHRMNELARQLEARLEELHKVIGHDKQ